MSSDSIADIVSVVTVMYTAALVFMVSVSIHLQKPYLKQGHYLIAIFGILDLYVSTMSTSLMAYLDNIAMSIIAALALSMFWLKGVYRLRMLIAVHVLVVGWLFLYSWVTYHSFSPLSLINLGVLAVAVSLIVYGWMGEYRKLGRTFFRR